LGYSDSKIRDIYKRYNNIKMKKNQIIKISAFVIILASIVLLIININSLNFEDFKSNNFASIIGNILTMTGMILLIIGLNKQK